MRLVIATDKRFHLKEDGTPCCADGTQSYKLWSRYLDVFESVTVVARLNTTIQSTGVPVVGDSVTLYPLEHYHGPEQYIRKRSRIRKQIAKISQEDAAFLLRVPGTIGSLMQKELQIRNCAYGVEVIGDPFTIFAPGACTHPLRPFFRWESAWKLRDQCRDAACATYVTARALQESYPPGRETFSVGCSDVEMPEDAFVAKPRDTTAFCKNDVTIVFVGTLAQLYKAPQILIEAFSQCLRSAPRLRLVMVGEGKHQDELKQLCRKNGIAEQVCFLGKLTAGEQIRQQLDQADLFVLPSFQEGLPRAMVEAMGRALPCIGSTVGGIPELLAPECLVTPGQVNLLASKILELVSNPTRLALESKRNLEVARCYHNDKLTARRNAFYRKLSNCTVASLSRVAA